MKPKKPIAKLHKDEMFVVSQQWYGIPDPVGMATARKSKKTTAKTRTSKGKVAKRTSKK